MQFQEGFLRAVVKGVYASKYPFEAEVKSPDYLLTEAVDALSLTPEGILGDRHFGFTMTSGARQTSLHPKGTLMRNNRQWTAISTYELSEIDANLSLDGKLTAQMMGTNILLDGLDHVSQLPTMTYLVFSKEYQYKTQRPEDVILVVYAQSTPCGVTGRAIGDAVGLPGLASSFRQQANGLRGTTGWIEKGGIIKPGYNCFILTPKGLE